jgi:hypothetical protein
MSLSPASTARVTVLFSFPDKITNRQAQRAAVVVLLQRACDLDFIELFSVFRHAGDQSAIGASLLTGWDLGTPPVGVPLNLAFQRTKLEGNVALRGAKNVASTLLGQNSVGGNLYTSDDEGLTNDLAEFARPGLEIGDNTFFHLDLAGPGPGTSLCTDGLHAFQACNGLVGQRPSSGQAVRTRRSYADSDRSHLGARWGA